MRAAFFGAAASLHKNTRGLTAIELSVVVAILSIMASLVAANTTGMGKSARGSVKSAEIAETQQAADGFVGVDPSASYPVSTTMQVVDQDGVPVVGQTLGKHNLPPAGAYAVLDFGRQLSTPEGANFGFVPDFLRRYPKHAAERPRTWLIDSSGSVTNTLDADSY